MNWLLVFVGGGFGSVARYAISLIFKHLGGIFPMATLVSNVLACVIIGVLTGLSLRGILADNHRLLLATGFCGGFSTFSTFSNETINMYQNGNAWAAFLNIALSFILCLAGTFWGLKMSF